MERHISTRMLWNPLVFKNWGGHCSGFFHLVEVNNNSVIQKGELTQAHTHTHTQKNTGSSGDKRRKENMFVSSISAIHLWETSRGFWECNRSIRIGNEKVREQTMNFKKTQGGEGVKKEKENQQSIDAACKELEIKQISKAILLFCFGRSLKVKLCHYFIWHYIKNCSGSALILSMKMFVSNFLNYNKDVHCIMHCIMTTIKQF